MSGAAAEKAAAGPAARSRVAKMGRFYRFLAARIPALLDDWERQRGSESRGVLSGENLPRDVRSGKVLSKGGPG